MKKLLTLIAAIIFCFNLSAQNILDDELVIITPDTVHLFFHGCSPHGEYVSITNNSSDFLIINRIYSDNYVLDCISNGEHISETTLFVSPGETIEFIVFVSLFTGNSIDPYGKMYIDTDLGLYSITIFYDEFFGVQDIQSEVKLYPNPADDHVMLNVAGHEGISVFNALGQKVDEFIPEHGEIVIPTTNYRSGVYFVKANGQTLKFLVTH